MKVEEAVLPSLSAMSLLIRSRFACRLLRVNSLCCSPECEKGNTRIKHRRSRPEVFCKKGVLRNFTKFTGKHLCQSLFFNKVTGLIAATLLNKRLRHRCFSVNFAKFLGTTFLQNTSTRLLIYLTFRAEV